MPNGHEALAPRIGIGLRPCFARELLHARPTLPFLEIIAENHLAADPVGDELLDAIAAEYPLSIHGVGASLGSADPLNCDHLQRLRVLIDRYKPILVSEHLCWSSVHGVELHELLPLPYTEEVVQHVAARIRTIQEFLGRRILIENVSTYLNFEGNTLTESAFLRRVVCEADCDILLDISNIVVNSRNHGYTPASFLAEVPWERVREIHLGGYEERDGYLLDSHATVVPLTAWELWTAVARAHPEVPTLLEWDNDLPSLAVLLEQVREGHRRFTGVGDLDARRHGDAR